MIDHEKRVRELAKRLMALDADALIAGTAVMNQLQCDLDDTMAPGSTVVGILADMAHYAMMYAPSKNSAVR